MINVKVVVFIAYQNPELWRFTPWVTHHHLGDSKCEMVWSFYFKKNQRYFIYIYIYIYIYFGRKL